MAFDAAGTRLGRGKGFYDRLLGTASFKAWKIGISWESRILPRLPRERHDIPMDVIITEQRVLAPCGLDIPSKSG
jgi:5-formyltetrahydrofolate cyclo-ligase